MSFKCPQNIWKIFKKWHVTHWLTPPPPYVTFGDIFVNTPLPPKVSRIFWGAPYLNNMLSKLADLADLEDLANLAILSLIYLTVHPYPTLL
jgi:hypothetical protein